MNLEKRKKKKKDPYTALVWWSTGPVCVCVYVRVCVSVQSLSKQLEAVKA